LDNISANSNTNPDSATIIISRTRPGCPSPASRSKVLENSLGPSPEPPWSFEGPEGFPPDEGFPPVEGADPLPVEGPDSLPVEGPDPLPVEGLEGFPPR
jgi:hypothetical protein